MIAPAWPPMSARTAVAAATKTLRAIALLPERSSPASETHRRLGVNRARDLACHALDLGPGLQPPVLGLLGLGLELGQSLLQRANVGAVGVAGGVGEAGFEVRALLVEALDLALGFLDPLAQGGQQRAALAGGAAVGPGGLGSGGSAEVSSRRRR